MFFVFLIGSLVLSATEHRAWSRLYNVMLFTSNNAPNSALLNHSE